jgi:hypothetical protein
VSDRWHPLVEGPVFAREKIATLHAWHGAALFLYLLKQSRAP